MGSKNSVLMKNNIIQNLNQYFGENAKIKDEENIKKPIFFGMLDYIYSFTGRKEYMNLIQKSITENMLTVISGFGGIGKTELVRFYAWKHKKFFNNNVVWINAATELSLKDCINKLVIELRIPTKFNGSSRREDAIICDIYNILNTKKCLIIFDNAENRKKIHTYLPQKHNTNVSVIITSRNQDWGTASVIPLSVLNPEDAGEFLKTYLQKSCNIRGNKKWIKKLAKKLQYLPLSLQQAVACINYKIIDLNEEFGVRQYIEQFEKKKMFNFTFERNNPFPESDENSYDKTLLKSVALSVDFIKNCPGLTLDILHFLAYLSPNNIQKNIFDSMETNVDELNSSLHILTKYSLIQKHQIEDQVYYNIHRLVQLSCRFIKNPEDGFCAETAKEVLSWTSKNLVYYRQHFISVVDLIMENKNHDVQFYFKLGKIGKSIDYRIVFYDIIKNKLKQSTTLLHPTKKKNIENFLCHLDFILTECFTDKIEECKQLYIQNVIENKYENTWYKDDYELQKYFNIEPNDINIFKQYVIQDTTSPLLARSSRLGVLKIIEYFNNMRIAIDKPIGPFGLTPLFIAASNGQKDVVQYLVKNKCDINFSTNLGITPLYAASKVDNLKLVQYLIENGADVNKVTTNLSTPLHAASHCGHKDIVEYYVKNIYDVNVLDIEKCSPLLYAIQNGHKSTVKFLLENGANVNQQDNRGNASIHFASRKGYFEIIKVLVEYNCDVNILTLFGNSALCLASFYGHLNIVQYLLKNKANICQCSEVLEFLTDNNILINEGSYVKAIASDEWSTVDVVYRTGLYVIVRYLLKNRSKSSKKRNRQYSVPYFYILFFIIVLLIYMYIRMVTSPYVLSRYGPM